MAPRHDGCRLTLAGHEKTRTFVCLSREFLAGPFRAPFGLGPCWASISETQVALNEARRVGMSPQQTQD